MFLSPSYHSAAGCHRNGLIVAKWGMLMQSSILPSAVGFLCPSHSAVCTVVHLYLHVHAFRNVAFAATSSDWFVGSLLTLVCLLSWGICQACLIWIFQSLIGCELFFKSESFNYVLKYWIIHGFLYVWNRKYIYIIFLLQGSNAAQKTPLPQWRQHVQAIAWVHTLRCPSINADVWINIGFLQTVDMCKLWLIV